LLVIPGENEQSQSSLGSSSSRRDRAERGQLIEAHLELVRMLARRYAGRGESLDDLIQVGSIGLIKASDRFDPSRGVAFATFATAEIEGEIRRHLRDRTSPLRIPRGVQRMTRELRERDGELAAALRRSPTVSELAAALGVDEREVERVLGAEQARGSTPITSVSGGDGVELAGTSEPLAASDDRMLLASSVRVLDERERQIVFLRFHADMTERQIGQELGISQAHVSRLLSGALEKLRASLAQSTGDKRDIASKTVISLVPGDTTIAAVGTSSGETRTLEDYLELPYHVSVRSQLAGAESSWSASVEELTGCAARGRTADEAVERLRPAMEAWLSDALAAGRAIPLPGRQTAKSKTSTSHSGRFLVRMPSELHERLAQAAEREDVSLNKLVTDVLAASVAARDQAERLSDEPSSADHGPNGQAPVATERSVPSAEHRPARALRLALATNLVVVLFAGVVAVALLVLALQRGV
jgi:RNA polymerase sigma-B factor